MAALLRVRASWIVTMTGLVPSEDIYTPCVNGKMASVGGGGVLQANKKSDILSTWLCLTIYLSYLTSDKLYLIYNCQLDMFIYLSNLLQDYMWQSQVENEH